MQKITFFDIVSHPWSFIIIRFLDLLFFTLAFLILFSLFYQNLNNGSFILYFISFYFISIVSIKPELILRFGFKRQNDQYKNTTFVKNFKKLLNKKLIIPIIIFPRLLFFNVLYYIFPIFVILTILYVILVYFEYTKLDSSFIQFAGLIGITSGLFQYYIKRYEEKIYGKITQKMSFISNAIIEESNYNKFKTFISNDDKHKNLITKIDEIYPKSIVLPLLRLQRVRGKVEVFPTTIYSQNINQEIFQILESQIKDNDKIPLQKAYHDFFDNVEEKVKDEIKKKEFILNELAILIISIINFTLESMTELLPIQQKIEESQYPETYNEFLNNKIMKITNSILTEYILRYES